MSSQPVADYFTTVSPPCCSCPDFRFRGRIRPCKHVAQLRAAYELIQRVEAKWGQRVEEESWKRS